MPDLIITQAAINSAAGRDNNIGGKQEYKSLLQGMFGSAVKESKTNGTDYVDFEIVKKSGKFNAAQLAELETIAQTVGRSKNDKSGRTYLSTNDLEKKFPQGLTAADQQRLFGMAAKNDGDGVTRERVTNTAKTTTVAKPTTEEDKKFVVDLLESKKTQVLENDDSEAANTARADNIKIDDAIAQVNADSIKPESTALILNAIMRQESGEDVDQAEIDSAIKAVKYENGAVTLGNMLEQASSVFENEDTVEDAVTVTNTESSTLQKINEQDFNQIREDSQLYLSTENKAARNGQISLSDFVSGIQAVLFNAEIDTTKDTVVDAAIANAVKTKYPSLDLSTYIGKTLPQALKDYFANNI